MVWAKYKIEENNAHHHLSLQRVIIFLLAGQGKEGEGLNIKESPKSEYAETQMSKRWENDTCLMKGYHKPGICTEHKYLRSAVEQGVVNKACLYVHTHIHNTRHISSEKLDL